MQYNTPTEYPCSSAFFWGESTLKRAKLSYISGLLFFTIKTLHAILALGAPLPRAYSGKKIATGGESLAFERHSFSRPCDVNDDVVLCSRSVHLCFEGAMLIHPTVGSNECLWARRENCNHRGRVVGTSKQVRILGS